MINGVVIDNPHNEEFFNDDREDLKNHYMLMHMYRSLAVTGAIILAFDLVTRGQPIVDL